MPRAILFSFLIFSFRIWCLLENFLLMNNYDYVSGLSFIPSKVNEVLNYGKFSFLSFSCFLYFAINIGLTIQKMRYFLFPCCDQRGGWYVCCDGWMGCPPSSTHCPGWYPTLCGPGNCQWVLEPEPRSHVSARKYCESGYCQYLQCRLPAFRTSTSKL